MGAIANRLQDSFFGHHIVLADSMSCFFFILSGKLGGTIIISPFGDRVTLGEQLKQH